MKKAIGMVYEKITHFIGRITGKYYFEDYIRVYPGAIKYNRFGKQVPATKNDINNYLNHTKFYRFSAQFVKGKKVADVGCGSGYGAEILKDAGASYIHGYDLSQSSIKFAKSHYQNIADFSIASITEMEGVADDTFDITISSEVMEHIKEYQMENKAMEQLKRVTKKSGMIVIGTPNIEVSPNHGFSFDEIDTLFRNNFKQYCIFENALYPLSGVEHEMWEKRKAEGKVGVLISEKINLDETYMRPETKYELKKGIDAGTFAFAGQQVDTTTLHNTHSWIALAINDK